MDIHSIYRVTRSRKQWLMVISGDRSSGYQRVWDHWLPLPVVYQTSISTSNKPTPKHDDYGASNNAKLYTKLRYTALVFQHVFNALHQNWVVVEGRGSTMSFCSSVCLSYYLVSAKIPTELQFKILRI